MAREGNFEISFFFLVYTVALDERKAKTLSEKRLSSSAKKLPRLSLREIFYSFFSTFLSSELFFFAFFLFSLRIIASEIP